MENNDLRIHTDMPVSELMHAVDEETSGLLEDDLSVNQEELAHWGIKGMRWGVRRYQRKDGTLTKAGQRRREKLENELKQLKGPKKRDASGKFVSDKPKEEVKKKPKSISEMDDAELRAYINRKAMERDAITVNSQLAALNPPKVSKGKQLISNIGKNVVGPIMTNVAKDVGQKYLTNVLNKKLGLGSGEKVNWDDMLKQQSYQRNAIRNAREDEAYLNKKRERQNQSNESVTDTVRNAFKEATSSTTPISTASKSATAASGKKVVTDNFDKEWNAYYKYLEDEYWRNRGGN